MLKVQPEKTETMKTNLFHANLRKEPPQAFKNISASNKKTPDDVLIVFRQKYVKPKSEATAKHKQPELTFDPNTKSLSDFLGELNECAERAFGDNVQHIIDNLFDAKRPLHLKLSLNLDSPQNVKYDEIVAHLQKELELSCLESDGELRLPTRTAVPPNDNPKKTRQYKIVCQYCKELDHVFRDCRKRMKMNRNNETCSLLQNTKRSASKAFAPSSSRRVS